MEDKLWPMIQNAAGVQYTIPSIQSFLPTDMFLFLYGAVEHRQNTDFTKHMVISLQAGTIRDIKMNGVWKRQ